MVATLEVHGFAERRDGKVALSTAYAALAADDAMVGLGDVLDRAGTMTRLVREAAQDPGDLSLGDAGALAVARAAGGRATPVTRAVYGQLYARIPECAVAIP